MWGHCNISQQEKTTIKKIEKLFVYGRDHKCWCDIYVKAATAGRQAQILVLNAQHDKCLEFNTACIVSCQLKTSPSNATILRLTSLTVHINDISYWDAQRTTLCRLPTAMFYCLWRNQKDRVFKPIHWGALRRAYYNPCGFNAGRVIDLTPMKYLVIVFRSLQKIKMIAW